MIVDALVWLGVAALTGIGIAALFLPSVLATLYGVPVNETHALAFVRAAGIRDLLIAAILAFTQIHGTPTQVAFVCAACAVLAIGDLLLVFGISRRMRIELAGHLLGGIMFGIITLLVLQR